MQADMMYLAFSRCVQVLQCRCFLTYALGLLKQCQLDPTLHVCSASST